MARKPFILAVLFSAFGIASAGTAGDSLFDRQTHDFGPIPHGPTQTTTFEVTNTAKTPVHLYGVRIPCSCVRASISKNDLKAGESTTVVVYLDTRRFTGPLTKYAFVQTDRPGQEEVRLTVKANIRQDLIVAPESLSFGRVKQGSPKDATVTVLLTGKAAGQGSRIAPRVQRGFLRSNRPAAPWARGGDLVQHDLADDRQPGFAALSGYRKRGSRGEKREIKCG